MTQLFVNNFSTTVAATFGVADTQLNLTSVTGLPALTGGNYFLLTVFRKTGVQEREHEVVKVTAVTGNMLTVVRAVEGVAASQFLAGDLVEARVTAGALGLKADVADAYIHPATHPVSIITQDASNRFVTDAEKAAWDAKQAALVSGTNIKTVNGQSLLGGGDLALASTSLSGNTTIYVDQVIQYTITDFDAFSNYAVSASAGSASITGAEVTFTTPAVAGNVTLTVTTNGVARAITLTVLAAAVTAPTITSPTAAATVVTETPTITSSAFATLGLADTHLNTDWELWTGPNRTGTKVASLYASTTSKTSWTIAAGVMAVNTTYYPAVLHRGTSLGASGWGVSGFTTATSFNAYIATPAPTPANFGDAFEGGFYGGLFWNQIAQSSSSKTLATGTQTFTVPDMTAAPIVYGGHILEVRSRSNPDNKFIGTVTGAIGTTLTLNVTSITGSGTFSDWSVMSRFRHIEAPKASGEIAAIALKNANDAFPAACQTLTGGLEATLAMVAAGNSTVYPAAHAVRALVINGKSDWHIPARDVRELSWRNLKPTADANYVTADRPTAQTFDYKNNGSYGDTANTQGLNKNSAPAGAAYTAVAPGQTAATAFRTGGAEAFEYGLEAYWSCSEYNATDAWRQYSDLSHAGYQRNGSKSNTYRVRACRRSII